MSYYLDDPAPYNFIGVMTTLPSRSRKRKNPIGFIWPKKPRRVRSQGKKSR